jgi:hypothetical protein
MSRTTALAGAEWTSSTTAGWKGRGKTTIAGSPAERNDTI